MHASSVEPEELGSNRWGSVAVCSALPALPAFERLQGYRSVPLAQSLMYYVSVPSGKLCTACDYDLTFCFLVQQDMPSSSSGRNESRCWHPSQLTPASGCSAMSIRPSAVEAVTSERRENEGISSLSRKQRRRLGIASCIASLKRARAAARAQPGCQAKSVELLVSQLRTLKGFKSPS
jgi:hypothetical protein